MKNNPKPKTGESANCERDMKEDMVGCRAGVSEGEREETNMRRLSLEELEVESEVFSILLSGSGGSGSGDDV